MTMAMDRAVQVPKWRRKGLILPAAVAGATVLAVLIGLMLTQASQRSVRAPRATVTIERVEHGVFRDFTPLRGKVAPKDVVYLDALEGGQVERVLARPGDDVAAGQPLLVFRNTALELDVLDREGRLVESITQLLSYEKQLEESRVANEKAQAQIDYQIVRLGRSAERTDALAAKGFVSRQRQDEVRDELTYQRKLRPLQTEGNARQEALRRQQLPQIRAQLASLRQSLQVTRAKLDNLVLRAPVPGKLTDIVQNIGQNRNRGERLGEIVAGTGYKVEAKVDEFYLGRVRARQVATANINGRSWKLTVDRVYPQVKDGVFTVDLLFAGPAPTDLLSGQAVDGKLSLGGDQPALILPAGAFLERTGGDWVMVVDGSGKHATRRRLQTGRRNAEQVEVLGGLKAGDQVITSDYSSFQNVDRVDLTK